MDVSLRIPDASGTTVLAVPTWVPGAYGFMKYGRDVFDVRARCGTREAQVRRTGWSGFEVEANGDLRLTWSAGAWDPAWGELAGFVDADQGVILATRWLHLPGDSRPCDVVYELPEGWALHHPGGAEEVESWRFRYASFAKMLDTPVVAGRFDRIGREAGAATLEFVFLDTAAGFDTEADRLADAFARVSTEAAAVFGGFPFDRYSFVCSFDRTAHWGLEHAHATMLGLGQEAFVDATAFARAVRVAAHEIFHVWNGCRLKDRALLSPDLRAGSFPDGLWLTEGFTRWYEFVLCARAGVLTPAQVLSNVVNYHRGLRALPAFAHTSARDSSLATFLNHNRYPGAGNATLDYYDLGMLVAFDLDATLRLAGSSLDLEMRAFFEAHAADGFTSESAIRFFAARHPECAEMLRREVETAGSLSAMALLGRLGFVPRIEQRKRLGIVLAEKAVQTVADVHADGPAARAGVAPGDEIVRVDGHPFGLKALKWLVERGRPMRLELARGDRKVEAEVVPEPRPDVAGLRFEGGPDDIARIEAWFGAPSGLKTGEDVPLDHHENFHGVQTLV